MILCWLPGKNSDLWEYAARLLGLGHDRILIRKTPAHLDENSIQADPDLQWMVHWNAAADTAAKVARLNAGSAKLRDHYRHLCAEYGWKKHRASRFRLFLLALVQKALSPEHAETEPADWDAALFFLAGAPNRGF